jgi:hypothetical protein
MEAWIIAPRILNFGNRERRVMHFSSQTFYLQIQRSYVYVGPDGALNNRKIIGLFRELIPGKPDANPVTN